MASGVSVERTALQSGIGVCKTCIHELADASRTLKRDYQSAGSGWKDLASMQDLAALLKSVVLHLKSLSVNLKVAKPVSKNF